MEKSSVEAIVVVGFEDLNRLKQKAARPQDVLDIERLRALEKRQNDERET